MDIFSELVSFLARAHILKIYELSKVVQQLRPKHVGTLINKKNVVQQIGVKSYILKFVAWKMYNITLVLKTFTLNRQHHIQSKYEVE